MSLANTVAGFTAQAGLLLDLPQQIATTANQRIAAMGDTYDALMSTALQTLVVDQANGLNTNPGTSVAPIRTLQRAMDMTPPGGRCVATIRGNYTVDGDIFVGNKVLQLVAESQTRASHNLTFDRYVPQAGFRAIRTFFLAPEGRVVISGMRIAVPPLDGSFTPLTPFTINLFTSLFSHGLGSLNVTLMSCDYVIPATPFCAMLQSGNLYQLLVSNVTLNGTITSFNGQVIDGITAPGGTAASSRPEILTNLTNI